MTLLALGISVVLLVLALRDVDWRQALETARGAQPAPAMAAFALLSLSYFLRGLRWRALVSKQVAVSRMTAFWATALSYLANALLPARAGDILRAEIVRRHTGFGARTFLIATVIVERIAEICTLVAISFIALATLPVLPAWLQTATRVMGAIALLGAVGILLARRAEQVVISFINVLPTSATNRARLSHLIAQASLGARALSMPQTAQFFFATTALIWALEIGYTLMIAQALGQQLSCLQRSGLPAPFLQPPDILVSSSSSPLPYSHHSALQHTKR